MAAKRVYFFGRGKAEGHGKMKDILGGKGAGLAEMTNLGVPVPPGFTISTEVCNLFYKNRGKIPADVNREIAAHLARLAWGEEDEDRAFHLRLVPPLPHDVLRRRPRNRQGEFRAPVRPEEARARRGQRPRHDGRGPQGRFREVQEPG